MKSAPDSSGDSETIRGIERLFAQQISAWPLLAQGIEGLRHAQTRPISFGWYDVFVRHIPHRLVSTTAKVDRASVEARPCFLCFENLPSEEKGLEFNSDFTFFCNPFPILDRHLTIVHREHRPQRIADQLPAMLDVAAALPGYFVLYNGPECGASAPDHLHFQACSRSLFPIEADSANGTGLEIENYGRRVLLFRDQDRERLAFRLSEAVGTLLQVTGKLPEPLLNIVAFRAEGLWTVCVFPRGKHRPSVFHTGELTVSPGAIDMSGVFVVPLERDFARINGSDIGKIYEEVTLPPEQFREVLAILEKKR